jgi:hypothetical protein
VMVPPSPAWVPSLWPLPRVSLHSHLSDNYKGDTQVKQGAGIYLKAEENPGKPQLGDCLKAV